MEFQRSQNLVHDDITLRNPSHKRLLSMAVGAVSSGAAFGNSEEVMRRFFRNGDPDDEEFAQFPDLAILWRPGKSSERALFVYCVT
jgi:hypothetical protein